MAERYMFTPNWQAPGKVQIIFFKEVSVILQYADNKYFKTKKPHLSAAGQ